MLCPRCGSENPASAARCSCGHDLSLPEQGLGVPKPKRRAFAALLSSLLLGPGAGHFAIGRYLRGIVWLALASIAALVIVTFAVLGVFPIWLLFSVFLIATLAYLGAAIDASVAKPPTSGLPPWSRVIGIWVALFVLSQGVRLGLRTFVVEAFKNPAGSMYPTLEVGDHFFVRKLGYELARGDIIVFASPTRAGQDYVKRVVALGNDLVELRDGRLLVNGRPALRQEFAGTCTYPGSDADRPDEVVTKKCRLLEEQLDGAPYRIIQDSESAPRSYPARRVPSDEIFVLGDNRDNSLDSRFFGPVPRASIKGKATVIWWSSAGEGLERFNLKVH